METVTAFLTLLILGAAAWQSMADNVKENNGTAVEELIPAKRS